MKLKLEQKSARIELIPLIDIIFLLLVFFIYSMLSMVVYRGIPVRLPAADTAETQQGEMLVITIDETGDIFVDKQPVAGRALLDRLKKEWTASPDTTAIISGHRDAPYRVFVDVLDRVRLAGFQNVSIEAMPRDRGPKGEGGVAAP